MQESKTPATTRGFHKDDSPDTQSVPCAVCMEHVGQPALTGVFTRPDLDAPVIYHVCGECQPLVLDPQARQATAVTIEANLGFGPETAQ